MDESFDKLRIYVIFVSTEINHAYIIWYTSTEINFGLIQAIAQARAQTQNERGPSCKMADYTLDIQLNLVWAPPG